MGAPLAADQPCALVLDGHTGAAVEAVQALARDGVQVDVSGPEGSLAFESRYVRRAFHQPESDAEFLAWLRDVDERFGYNLVLSSSDNALYPFLEISDGDPLRTKAVLPSNHALKVAFDKGRIQTLARQLGISVVPSQLVEWLDDVPPVDRFPVVLTPVQSIVNSAGRLRSFEPVRVENEEQRQAQLSYLVRHVPVLQHQFIPGQSWGVTLVYAYGQCKWRFAYERLHELAPGGACSYRRTALAPDSMVRDAIRLLDVLEWHGVADVDFIMAEDGRCLLTGIRPALGDSLALIVDAGANLPAALLQIAMDEALPAQPDYHVPLATRDVAADDRWIRQHLRSRDTVAAISEIFKTAVPFLGHERWDNFDWHDLGVTGAILGRLWKEWWGKLGDRLEMQSLEELARSVHERNLNAWVASGKRLDRVLFLCYGNICRSPIAEAVARRDLPHAHADSAGFFAIEGRRSPDNVRWAAGQMGLDLSHWASRLVSDDLVGQADLVFVMDLYNFQDFRVRYRGHMNKVLLLGMFGEPPSPAVVDPYQKGPEETMRVLRQIERAVRNAGSRLGSGELSAVTAGAH